MLGLYSNKTCGTMTNYDNGDDDGDDDIYNNGNEDGNGDDNSTSGSGSDGPIFYLIMITWSCGGFLGGDGNSAAAMANYIYKCQTIYLPFKESFKMCNKFGMCVWDYFRTNYLHVQLCNLDTSFFVFVQLFSKLVLHVFSTATSWTGYTCSS